MKFQSTPLSAFKNLLDYPFTPNFIEVEEGMKMHYVDEGSGPVVLLLHGEPSWSYLYRKMIPVLVDNGFRVLAPDLIGFGKSDKPTEQSDYTYENHLRWLKQLVLGLELDHINLFCQDWGGLLGLRMVADHSDQFDRVVVANTFLPKSGIKTNEAFAQWRDFSQNAPEFQSGKIIQMATTTNLSPEVIAAYDAPFPDDSYKAGARVFPLLVPFDDSDTFGVLPKCDEAWADLCQFEKPFLTLFSDSDPIMSGLEKIFQKVVPGTKGQAHKIIENAGHFLQEDKGEEIAHLMSDFIKTT
jgi:haloalkane dehalogenase